MYEGDDIEHSFPIPFLVSNGLYYVPRVNENKEGLPKILNLRDLTGEGVAGQFVLFEYVACTISLTTAVGYSPHSDRAVQYQVETFAEDLKPNLVSWIEQVFGVKPLRPGHWDFNWAHVEVTFDRTRQVFVEQ